MVRVDSSSLHGSTGPINTVQVSRKVVPRTRASLGVPGARHGRARAGKTARTGGLRRARRRTTVGAGPARGKMSRLLVGKTCPVDGSKRDV